MNDEIGDIINCVESKTVCGCVVVAFAMSCVNIVISAG